MASDSPADVSDEATADSLRSQHSNEEAIAAVNANSHSGNNRVEGHAAAFEMWTDEELHTRAKEVGLDPSGLSREELIERLQEH